MMLNPLMHNSQDGQAQFRHALQVYKAVSEFFFSKILSLTFHHRYNCCDSQTLRTDRVF